MYYNIYKSRKVSTRFHMRLYNQSYLTWHPINQSDHTRHNSRPIKLHMTPLNQLDIARLIILHIVTWHHSRPIKLQFTSFYWTNKSPMASFLPIKSHIIPLWTNKTSLDTSSHESNLIGQDSWPIKPHMTPGSTNQTLYGTTSHQSNFTWHPSRPIKPHMTPL